MNDPALLIIGILMKRLNLDTLRMEAVDFMEMADYSISIQPSTAADTAITIRMHPAQRSLDS